MSRVVAIPGFRVKNGKVVRSLKHLSVSKRLQVQSSRKVRVARRGQPR